MSSRRLQIFFCNPRFASDQWDGARVHVTQVVDNLAAQGHDVWTLPLYPVERARPVPRQAYAKLRQLRRMDACYLRIEGAAPPLPAAFRRPLRSLTGRVPIVWEVNATPELRFNGRDVQDVREHEAALRQLAADTALAICNTDGLARFARDLGVPKAITVPLGSAPAHFRPDVPPDPSIPRGEHILNVVWCGNAAVGWHDIGTILESARLLEGRSSARFYLVCKSLPTEGRLPSNVVRLPMRSYADMPALLSAMDVGLAIYRAEGWSRYGTFSSPLKVFDYLASGLTTVCSPIEQTLKLHEISEAAVRLVRFEDPGDLADALLSLEADRSGRCRRASAARSLVSDYFNWSRVASETAAAIRGLS